MANLHCSYINTGTNKNFSIKFDKCGDLNCVNVLIFGTRNYMSSDPILITFNVRMINGGKSLSLNSKIISGTDLYVGIGGVSTNVDVTGLDDYSIFQVLANGPITREVW